MFLWKQVAKYSSNLRTWQIDSVSLKQAFLNWSFWEKLLFYIKSKQLYSWNLFHSIKALTGETLPLVSSLCMQFKLNLLVLYFTRKGQRWRLVCFYCVINTCSTQISVLHGKTPILFSEIKLSNYILLEVFCDHCSKGCNTGQFQVTVLSL